MNRHLLLGFGCIAALAGSPAGAANFVDTVKSTNPIAYFRLTANGTPSEVGGYTTTYTPTTGTTAPGGGAPLASDPANTAATFTGNNSAPSQVTTSLSGMIPAKGSINAWINLSALPSTFGQYFYIAGESQGGNDFDFQIQNDNRLYIYTGSSENTSFELDTSFIGQWHMVTASYDATLGAASFRNLYIDGQSVATYTGGVSAGTKTSPFTIGYSNIFGGRDFAGGIDEVAVWGYGLSAAQIQEIYRSRLDAATAVPEPATWGMMLAGFALLGTAVRRRRTPRLA